MVCYNQSGVTIWLRNDFLFDCYITYHVHTYMKSLSTLCEPNLISNGERNHFINVFKRLFLKPIILLYSEPFSSLSTRVKYTILCTFKLSLLPFILRNHSCIIFPSFLSSHKDFSKSTMNVSRNRFQIFCMPWSLFYNINNVINNLI